MTKEDRNEFKEIMEEVLFSGNLLTKDDAKNFLTKEDAKNFLTKEDAKNFLTKEDAKNFATKDDFKSLEAKMHDYFLLIENSVVPKIDAMYDALCTRVTHEECDKRMGKVEEKATVIDPLMVTVGKHSEKLLEHEERLEKLEALGV